MLLREDSKYIIGILFPPMFHVHADVGMFLAIVDILFYE